MGRVATPPEWEADKLATTIRLTRMGKKKRPFYRLVVLDSRKRRDGAYLANREGTSARIPVIANVEVVDTSGCGDSFCAGFQVGLANGMDPLQAAHFASATAAQVASAVGSDGAVRDYASTLKIMQDGAMPGGTQS